MATMSGERLGSVGLAQTRRLLSERDLTIVAQVGELRLMRVAQIEKAHFPIENFASELSARRVARRVLERLTRERLLVRLERRIGGAMTGSAGFVYGLGPVGARVLGDDNARRHYREPSEAFLEHTLAIADVVVDLLVGRRSGGFEVLELEAEPRCWRSHNGLGGRQLLRPDLFVSLGIGEFEHRCFLEIDLGTEHLPTLVRKCQAYLVHYRSGVEQETHGVYPTVWWVVQTRRRVEQLTKALQRTRGPVDNLFVVTLAEDAVKELTAGLR